MPGTIPPLPAQPVKPQLVHDRPGSRPDCENRNDRGKSRYNSRPSISDRPCSSQRAHRNSHDRPFAWRASDGSASGPAQAPRQAHGRASRQASRRASPQVFWTHSASRQARVSDGFLTSFRRAFRPAFSMGFPTGFSTPFSTGFPTGFPTGFRRASKGSGFPMGSGFRWAFRRASEGFGFPTGSGFRQAFRRAFRQAF